METSAAEIETLATKHKHYNIRVQDAISTGSNPKEVDTKIEDLENLMQIDIASNKRDVDYILNVLKSHDMLYVSRALHQSPWLADDQYANVMNPKYLRENLLPHMTTKAGIKLMKHIRHNISNEKRAEEFYKNEPNIESAVKWLSRCSVEFIEKELSEKRPHLKSSQLQRLCERSFGVYDIVFEYLVLYSNDRFKSTLFLLKTHTEKYLDVLERKGRYHYSANFNDKSTKIIMTKCSEKVMNKIDFYINKLHLPTFVKHLNSDEIKSFLYKIANNDEIFKNHSWQLFRYDNIKHFVKRLPKEEQFDFVKKLFLDNPFNAIDYLKPGTEEFARDRIRTTLIQNDRSPVYVWYSFAPFNTAFEEIMKLIFAAKSNEDKNTMLLHLISMADRKTEYLQPIFAYYNKPPLKDDTTVKENLIKTVLTQTDVHKFDDGTWNELDKIITSISSDKIPDDCAEVIIIYHVLRNKPVPENVTQYLNFVPLNSSVKYKSNFTKDERELLFNFLYNVLINKLNNHKITDEKSFEEAVKLVEYLLDLLKAADKNIINYSLVLEKVRQLLKMKQDNSWKTTLSHLYNKNKSWRIHMFEESLALYPTEEACVNALKHDPSLLSRHDQEVKNLCTNDKVSLNLLHKKLRVYWSSTIAKDWTKVYVERLDAPETDGHVALIRALFTLLPQEEVNDIVQKYAPAKPKIDWIDTNAVLLSLQRCIAKNMHIARPQATPDEVLLYAKGDYLQYALPSVLAIFYNLSQYQSQNEILKLLNVPVSLQKHGLRFAFQKLEHDLLKEHLSNTWKNSKNATIKLVIFQLTFARLTKERDEAKAFDLWELMDIFIDNLTFNEDKKIYNILSINEIDSICIKVRALFLVKSYKFLIKLYEHTKDESYSYHIDELAKYTRNVMEYVPTEFVEELISKFLEERLFKLQEKGKPNYVYYNTSFVRVLTSYLLCAKDEETQLDRYERIFVPMAKRAMDMWNEKNNENYYIRGGFQEVLTTLLLDLKEYVNKNNMIIPTRMYQNIWDDIKHLGMPENYYTLTIWKLTVKLTELFEKHKNEKSPNIGDEVADIFINCLQEDVKRYFSSIYLLYAKVLKNIMPLFDENENDSVSIELQIYERLLYDKNCVEAYLTVIELFPAYPGQRDGNVLARLKKMIREHPSVAVKMHFYNHFEEQEWEI